MIVSRGEEIVESVGLGFYIGPRKRVGAGLGGRLRLLTGGCQMVAKYAYAYAYACRCTRCICICNVYAQVMQYIYICMYVLHA